MQKKRFSHNEAHIISGAATNVEIMDHYRFPLHFADSSILSPTGNMLLLGIISGQNFTLMWFVYLHFFIKTIICKVPMCS